MVFENIKREYLSIQRVQPPMEILRKGHRLLWRLLEKHKISRNTFYVPDTAAPLLTGQASIIYSSLRFRVIQVGA